MYRLLIVDDEPDVADGLYDVMKEIEDIDLDIYKAYSAFEALDILSVKKVDILLTDIRMPGLTGLQLVEKVHVNWPKCRVIFLTGYNEFEYIYKAIQLDGVSYLLKTESFEKIITAVKNAAVQIENSNRMDELVSRAKDYMEYMEPLMQREYLAELIKGEETTDTGRTSQFRELNISLHPKERVILLVGRFYPKNRQVNTMERSKIAYAVKNIANQHFSPILKNVFIAAEGQILIWIIQPVSFADGPEEEENHWKGILSLIRDCAESIQDVCISALYMELSFALSAKPVTWESIAMEYDALKLLFYSHMNKGMSMICSNVVMPGDTVYPENSQVFFKIKTLETFLESGQKEEFYKVIRNVGEYLTHVSSMHYNPAIEIFYSISVIFLSYINRYHLTEKVAFKIGLHKLAHLENHSSWKEASEYFMQLAVILFELKAEMDENNTESIIDSMIQYIREHLHENLSLSVLADKVHFNPSYLSRIFKQTTGVNLLTYINNARLEKAKELLKNSEKRIHEIAAAVGYDSPSYFTQFFKRNVNMSPQDYKSATARGKEL